MEITALHTTKRGRVSLYLEGEFACVLHPEVLAFAGLAVGEELSPERLEELCALSGEKLAREKALALLACRARTRKSLQDTLARSFGEESAEVAADRMEELGLLDDRDYARRFAAGCLERKGFSAWKTRQELRQKGIDPDLIEEVMGEFSPDPGQTIEEMIRRKRLSGFSEQKGYRRAVAALQRLGYRYDEIAPVLRRLIGREMDEDPGFGD